LADVVVFAGVGVGAFVEVVGAEVMEPGLGVLEEVPDDDKDGPSDGDDGTLLASASGDPSVAFAEEGFGPSSDDGGFAENPGEVAVAVPGGTVAFGLSCR
jgi:hypothetical protein